MFTREEISAEAVMASACLPFLFRAVEIDGVPYWDGGYMRQPAVSPVPAPHRDARTSSSSRSTRCERREVPTTTRES